MKSTSIGYATRDHRSRIIIAGSKRIEDYDILVVEYLVVDEAILKTSQKDI